MFGHGTSFLTANSSQAFGQAATKAIVHGLSQSAIAEVRYGTAKGVFLSSFVSSGFSIGNKGYGNAMSRTAIMAIVGGTTSAIGGGKFANGAMSAGFVHMFNSEARMSLSYSGGAGSGGTREVGISLAHDDNQPWYKGWSGAGFTNAGDGDYLDAGLSGEFNIGWSDNNNVGALRGPAYTVGGSYGEILESGYEVTYSQSGKPLHNFSFGIGSPSPIPIEVHRYKTYTKILDDYSFGVKK